MLPEEPPSRELITRHILQKVFGILYCRCGVYGIRNPSMVQKVNVLKYTILNQLADWFKLFHFFRVQYKDTGRLSRPLCADCVVAA
jgi:hypothetical protein